MKGVRERFLSFAEVKRSEGSVCVDTCNKNWDDWCATLFVLQQGTFMSVIKFKTQKIKKEKIKNKNKNKKMNSKKREKRKKEEKKSEGSV